MQVGWLAVDQVNDRVKEELYIQLLIDVARAYHIPPPGTNKFYDRPLCCQELPLDYAGLQRPLEEL